MYLLCRSTNNPKLKNHYKTYCRILSDVIKTAKNYIIINSLQIPITRLNLYGTLLKWKQKKSNDNGPPLNIDGKTYQDYQSIANIFNTYFTTITDKMPVNNSVTMNLALNYLYKVFIRPFPHIK